MDMVLVKLPDAVADRPLLLRDENPMSGGMASKGQALQACISWPPDKRRRQQLEICINDLSARPAHPSVLHTPAIL